MDSNELSQVLAAIAEQTQTLMQMTEQMIDKRMEEQTQTLMRMTEQMIDKRMEEQTQALIQRTEQLIDKRVSEAETRINMKIEHEISRKIESLFDGYKLAHEKQWELDRENERLKARVDDIEVRLAVLESKSA